MKRAATSFGGLVQAEARERRQRHDFPGPSASVAAAPRTERLLLGGALVVAIGALFVPQAHGTVNPEPDPYPSGAPAPDPHPSATSSAPRVQPEPDPVATSSVPKIQRAPEPTPAAAPASSTRGVTAQDESATVRSSTPSSVERHRLERRSRTRARRRRQRGKRGPRLPQRPTRRLPRRRRRRRSPLLRSRRPRRPPMHDHWRWRGWRSSRWFWRARACCTS